MSMILVHEMCLPTTILVHCTHQYICSLFDHGLFQNRIMANVTALVYAQWCTLIYMMEIGSPNADNDMSILCSGQALTGRTFDVLYQAH